MDKFIDDVTVKRKNMLWYSRGFQRPARKWCHLMLFRSGFAWRPFRFGIDWIVPHTAGFTFIPFAAITGISLKASESVSTKILQIETRHDEGEPCTLEFEVSWAIYWVRQLRKVGIEVRNADLVDSRTLRG